MLSWLSDHKLPRNNAKQCDVYSSFSTKSLFNERQRSNLFLSLVLSSVIVTVTTAAASVTNYSKRSCECLLR